MSFSIFICFLVVIVFDKICVMDPATQQNLDFVRNGSNSALFKSLQYVTKETSGRRQKLELYIGPNKKKLKNERHPYPFFPTMVPYREELKNTADGTSAYPEYVRSRAPGYFDKEKKANSISLPSLSAEQSRQLGTFFFNITTLWIVIGRRLTIDIIADLNALFLMLEMVGHNLVDFRISVTVVLSLNRESPQYFTTFNRLLALINSTMVNLKTLTLNVDGRITEEGVSLDLPVLSHLDIFYINCLPTDLKASFCRYVQPRVVDGSAPFHFYSGQLFDMWSKSSLDYLDNHYENSFLETSCKELSTFYPLDTPLRLPLSSLCCLTLRIFHFINWTQLSTTFQSLGQSLEHLTLDYFDLALLSRWSGELSGRTNLLATACPLAKLKSIKLIIIFSSQLESHFILDELCIVLQVLTPALQILDLHDFTGTLSPCICCSNRNHTTPNDCRQKLFFPLQFLPSLRYVVCHALDGPMKRVWSKQHLQQLSPDRD